MSALIRSAKILGVLSKNPTPIYTVVRNHWNKDFKPGPYPKTEEERNAAAKKYGLLPHEYKPYPDDGGGIGDYPQLPDIPVEQRDITYPYDLPDQRRNFGEAMHINLDIYDETRLGTAAPLRYPLWKMCLLFFGTMFTLCGLTIWCEDKKHFQPAMPKQLPADGNKHYTFEPLR